MNNKILLIITVIVALLSGWLMIELISLDVEPFAEPGVSVVEDAVIEPTGSMNVQTSVTIPGQPAQVRVEVR